MSVSPSPPRRVSFPIALLTQAVAGLIVGAALAALLGVGSFYVLRGWASQANIELGLVAIQVYLALLGFAIGAALGVSFVGRRLGYGGSVALALLAGVVGIILAALAIRFGGRGSAIPVQVGLGVLAALALTLLGYHIRRKETL